MKKVALYLCGFICVVFLAFGAQGGFAGTPPSLELLSPTRGEEVPFGTAPVVAISIFDAEGDTDITTAELKIDDVEVTQQANVSALLVTYTMEGAAAGKHTISFTLKDQEGNKTDLESFFTILGEPKREKKVTANGTIKVGAEYSTEADQSVVGLLEASVYGRLSDSIDYSANVELTNEEASDGQRVSTYRLDLRAPFGIAVLGDATPNFGAYSINGQSVFGVHLLPQFGIFGLELLYGQSLRKVDDPETFRQMVYGGKFKVGNPRALLWGLTFLKVKDDKDSPPEKVTPPTVTPKDNIVLGTDFAFSLSKDRVAVKMEANKSLLNEDITGGAADSPDIDFPSWLKPDALEWLFVINEHVVPLKPRLLSTENLAARAAIKVGPFFDNTLNAEYSYVGPSYNSLANTSIVKDRAGIKAYDTLWLLQKKVYLNLAFQYYNNNLEDTLTNTTKTTGFSTSTYIYPTDYLTFNAGVDLQRANNTAEVDTVNTNINGGVTYELEVWKTNSSVYLTQNASLFKDNFTPANDQNKYSTRLGAISYFTGIPLDTKAVVGLDFGDIDTSLYIEGKAGYRFLKDETLYAFTDAVYETGPEQLDWKMGADYEAPFDITFEADLELISAPGSSDVIISAYATKRF